jgi:hypothetical protein
MRERSPVKLRLGAARLGGWNQTVFTIPLTHRHMRSGTTFAHASHRLERHMVHDVAVGGSHCPTEMGSIDRNIVAHWQTVD